MSCRLGLTWTPVHRISMSDTFSLDLERGLDTVSQPEHSRLCDVKPTFSTLGGVLCNFQEWCKYVWAARQSSLDYIWLHLLYRKEDSPCKSVVSFSGISDVKHTGWQAAVICLLCRGAVSLFSLWVRKDKGGKQSFSSSLTPEMSLNLPPESHP